jgi:large subunit ribosomal protein L19
MLGDRFIPKIEGFVIMSEQILESLKVVKNENVPIVNPGDLVSVFLRIKEGGNERVQEFKGTVLCKRGGMTPTFTVRRIASNGVGVERTFLTASPRIEKVVIHRSSHVRRAKLYHLRERTGKSARLKQKFN